MAGLGSIFVLADEARLLGARTRLTVAVGVLGGFTTWSTFMTGSVVLIQAGHPLVAALYLAAALAGGPLAVLAGSTATRLALAGSRRRLTSLHLAAEMAAIEAEDREAGNGR
jgi:CrcB protein